MIFYFMNPTDMLQTDGPGVQCSILDKSVSPSIMHARSTLQKQKLHKFETACLANLVPSTAEEAKALLPRWEGQGVGLAINCSSFLPYADIC